MNPIRQNAHGQAACANQSAQQPPTIQRDETNIVFDGEDGGLPVARRVVLVCLGKDLDLIPGGQGQRACLLGRKADLGEGHVCVGSQASEA